ncbi:hypothetical protein AAFF_G00353320 [Aldrovandia affinis]|uniref:Uncharacterized protein n=1 Tax=Aldrovandia affinis TaxID=143900 RepID=A0AAD7R7N9_9TELE|nr:hypothetical protein AAFF_G00353320 [Aldrovandia affinis]
MSRLPIDHPEVHQQFMHGGFSVQLGSQNPFGRIPVDQTIEETVNRDTQTAGGTRRCTTGIQFRNIAPGHRTYQWRKFLSSSANKANLIRFLVAEWKTPKLRDRLNDKQLYVASEESCLHITKDQWASRTKKRLTLE